MIHFFNVFPFSQFLSQTLRRTFFFIESAGLICAVVFEHLKITYLSILDNENSF